MRGAPAYARERPVEPIPGPHTPHTPHTPPPLLHPPTSSALPPPPPSQLLHPLASSALSPQVAQEQENLEDDPARSKGGRELRPLRPPKPHAQEELPRDMFRARLPGQGGKKPPRDRDGDAPQRDRSRPARPQQKPARHQHDSDESRPRDRSGGGGSSSGHIPPPSQNFLGLSSTRVAVFEDGVWCAAQFGAIRRTSAHFGALGRTSARHSR